MFLRVTSPWSYWCLSPLRKQKTLTFICPTLKVAFSIFSQHKPCSQTICNVSSTMLVTVQLGWHLFSSYWLAWGSMGTSSHLALVSMSFWPGLYEGTDILTSLGAICEKERSSLEELFVKLIRKLH